MDEPKLCLSCCLMAGVSMHMTCLPLHGTVLTHPTPSLIHQ